MLLAVVGAGLVVCVVVALGFPLLRRPRELAERAQYDRAVYRDQLREVERDLARGVLNPAEADSARLEIQRRMLAVAETGTGPVTGRRSPVMASIALVVVVGGASLLYWKLGAPGLPDAPAGTQLARQETGSPKAAAAAQHTDMQDAADKLAAKLQQDPNNRDGWILYARTVSMMGQWGKAKEAYRKGLELGAGGADVYAGYGEMLLLESQGVVTPAAETAFRTALKSDPKNDVARFYLALADSQAGDVKKAIAGWLALASEIPDDSPMRDEITRRVAEAARSGGFPPPPLPKGMEPAPEEGPTPEQMAQAENMTPAEREALVGGMIAKLAEKLKASPEDADGWQRLGRAYGVQGHVDLAVEAFDKAIKLKPQDAAVKLEAVGALVAGLKPADPIPARAIALLRDVAAVTPEAPEVLWYLGIVAAREGRPDEARQDWNKLLVLLAPGGEDAKMVKGALDELPKL